MGSRSSTNYENDCQVSKDIFLLKYKSHQDGYEKCTQTRILIPGLWTDLKAYGYDIFSAKFRGVLSIFHLLLGVEMAVTPKHFEPQKVHEII